MPDVILAKPIAAVWILPTAVALKTTKRRPGFAAGPVLVFAVGYSHSLHLTERPGIQRHFVGESASPTAAINPDSSHARHNYEQLGRRV